MHRSPLKHQTCPVVAALEKEAALLVGVPRGPPPLWPAPSALRVETQGVQQWGQKVSTDVPPMTEGPNALAMATTVGGRPHWAPTAMADDKAWASMCQVGWQLAVEVHCGLEQVGQTGRPRYVTNNAWP